MIDTTNSTVGLVCSSCKKIIPWDAETGFLDRCARITAWRLSHLAIVSVNKHGELSLDLCNYDEAAENVKFERFICQNCFLTDPDLCRFFNRIDCRVR